MQTTLLHFPTGTILLREIATHFGLKNNTRLAKQIDEYTDNIHYPHYFEESFIKALFDTKYFSSKTQSKMIHAFRKTIQEFYDFQLLFSLNGDAQQKTTDDFLNLMLSVKFIPILKQHLISLGCISKNQESHFLCEILKQNFNVKKLDKELQDRFRVWGNLEELPDPQSLQLIVKNHIHFTKQADILSALLMARALDSLYKNGITEKDISDQEFAPFIQQTLNSENELAYMHLSMNEFIFSSLLKLPKENIILDEYKDNAEGALSVLYKSIQNQSDQLLFSLTNINLFMETIDQYPEFKSLHFSGYWAKARFYLFTGKLDDAIQAYTECVESCIQYDGRNLEQILTEALTVCSLQNTPDNNSIRKFANIAIRYQLRFSKVDLDFDNLPQKFKRENVFESWELKALRTQVYNIFDQQLFLTEECFFLNNLPNQKFLTLKNKIRINLDQPNKVIKIDEQKTVKMTQLLYAIQLRDVKTVKALLDAGADVNQLSNSNDSALTMCLYDHIMELSEEQQQILSMLLKHTFLPATLNAISTKIRLSVLHIAIQLGDSNLVQKIIAMGASVNLLADIDQHSPLHLALKLLHHAKRQFHFKDMIQRTLLHPEQSKYSLYQHSAGKLKLNDVLKNLNTPKGRMIGQEVFEAMKSKASVEQLNKILFILLKAGANVNQPAKLPISGYTPFMLALEGDEYEIAQYMLEQCKADMNGSYVDPRNGQLVFPTDIINHFKSTQCKQLIH
ncbi:ankyrin repeat domain-containing protein [Acinetobacter guillouiae]|uniref:ankyrin repeat domain-containing protein n=1 Tax=Acinetobacter guillouiae TaxID=106649 RepID=UPI0028D0475F|nr:ankyrin repeat domain-containing protein [Acinetobacter guillouiae]